MTDPFEAYAAALGVIDGLAETISNQPNGPQGMQPTSVETLIATLERADQLAKMAKDLKASAMAVIENVTAGQPDGEIHGTTKKITFERTDTEDWDQEALANHFGSSVPDYVVQKLSVPAKIIKALPATEQAALQLCRRVKGSKLNISIESAF